MSAEMEIYEDSTMIDKLIKSAAFAEVDKEAGPAMDMVSKGLKVAKKSIISGAKKTDDYVRNKSYLSEAVREANSEGKQMITDFKRNQAKIRQKNTINQYNKDSKLLKDTGSPGKGELMFKGDAKKDTDRLIRKNKRLKSSRNRDVAMGAGAGAGAGAIGANEYANSKKSTVDKTAGLDKEASRFGFLRNGIKSMMMKSRMGSSRVAKLKNIEATRKTRDASTAALRGKHNAELTSGRYKGMEGALSKRQTAETAAARKTYNTSVNSQNLPNTKPLGTTANNAAKEQKRVGRLNKKKDPMDRIDMKQMKKQQGTGYNIKNLNTNTRPAFRKPAVPTTPIVKPQVGAVNLGKMKVTNPVNKPAPANNSIFGGNKNIKLNARNIGAGAVGLTAGSQVYDGLSGGGRGTRVINQY